MYSDSSKNLVLFLPDNFSDDDILSLATAMGATRRNTTRKITSCIDLVHNHATYSVNDIAPSEFCIEDVDFLRR